MGLKIVNGFVIVDHAVIEHLHTTRDGNPTEFQIDDLKIHSVYKRLKNSAKLSRDRNQKKTGDNCPLIYVIKGGYELSIDRSSVNRLLDHVPGIISEICAKIDDKVDGIVAMPSSFPIANWLATRIQREMGIPFFKDVLRKSTNSEAASRVEMVVGATIEGVSNRERKQIQNAVKMTRKNGSAIFSTKKIPVPIRKYFDPVMWNGLICSNSHRLLLVDDLLASGGTFSSARCLLMDQGWPAPQHAITWFSAV